MRFGILAAALSGAVLAACSSTDLAEFNVAMDEANGAYWPDQSQSQTLACGSGNGYIMEYSGASGGQGFLYFVSYADAYTDITVTYEDGDTYTAGISYGETSYTMYNHPGFGWNSAWAC